MKPRIYSLAVAFVVSALSGSVAFAAGFELLEQSAKGLGQAFSGAATGYGDGSESYLNPGALSAVEDGTYSVHVHLIMPKAEFSDDGSSLIPALGGAPLSGDTESDGGENAAVPNVYLTKQVGKDLTLGLGLNSPFGLSTKYNSDWVGRYHAIQSELTTFNINPAIAFKQSEYLSIGAGMQIMYADAKLTNAVDFGTIGLSALGPATAAPLGLLPQRADGSAKVEGDDWGVGMGLGALITPSDDFRIGISWRSKIHFTLDGDGEFSVPANAAVLTRTGLFTDTDAEADLTTPESITGGFAWDINSNWTWYGDATWTKWDRFEELRVNFAGPQPDSVQDENWDNAWRLSTGTSYRIDDAVTVRGGFTWDQSPVSSDELRTPRIPDNDRFWLAGGLSYRFTERLEGSLGYAHLFVPDAESAVLGSTGAQLVGDWNSGVDIVSLGLVGRF